MNWYTMEGYPNIYDYVDLNGNPVTRNPRTDPYSYDPYVTYKSESPSPDMNRDSAVYSDRMTSWDYDKFGKACYQAFGNDGQLFSNRKPEDIQKFLQIYFDCPTIKLTAVMQGCNVSNGYPYWIFYYFNYEKV